MTGKGLPMSDRSKFGYAYHLTRYKDVPRTCQECGAAFMAWRYAVQKGNGRFCSRACKCAGSRCNPAKRFWTYVRKTRTCWLWTGWTDPHGYGGFGGKRLGKCRAHRFSYAMTYGPIPAGMDVCHRCDVPGCVRPSHLFLGTRADNMRDASAKGRTQRGDRHRFAKLTSDDIRKIRASPTGYGTGRALARHYGVSASNICLIRKGRNWAHVA